MKKKLRSQIRLLAEQILSKDSLDTNKMKELAGNLYEKLSILEYLEGQVLDYDSNEGITTSLDSKTFREQNWFKEPEPLPKPERQEEIIEPLMEKIKDLIAQMPEESQKIDNFLEEVLPKKEYQKNDLEEFAKSYQEMPVFERKDKITKASKSDITKTGESQTSEPEIITTNSEKLLNNPVAKGLTISPEDKLSFIKHLFDGNTEDYARVISQISSFGSYHEAEAFIKGKVKPDYNYWLHKHELSGRFMKLVENNFQ